MCGVARALVRNELGVGGEYEGLWAAGKPDERRKESAGAEEMTFLG